MRVFSSTPLKVAALTLTATMSLSLAACDGGSSADDHASSAVADPLFTKGKIDQAKFAKEVKTSMTKVKTYRMETTVTDVVGNQKTNIKITTDYDGTEPSKPRVHMSVTDSEMSGVAEQVIIGDQAYAKKKSKWEKTSASTKSDDFEPGAVVAGLVQSISDLTYIGKESRGHRYDTTVPANSEGATPNASPSDAEKKTLSKVTYWLDDAKRFTGIKVKGTSGEVKDTTVDISFSKYNEKIEIPKVS